MVTILLHSSKTMVPAGADHVVSRPEFLEQAQELRSYVASLSVTQIEKVMRISPKAAERTAELYTQRFEAGTATPAVETFRGDIYSGLRALDWELDEREFAQDHLRILSGLYGILRPFDGILPYRLEAGYRLPDDAYKNLYMFWGKRLAETIPPNGPIINLTSAEYGKLITPYVDAGRLITPQFLTIDAKGEPMFVVVHAKIARGALARWFIKRGQNTAVGVEEFNDLGYVYRPDLSTDSAPVFVAERFQGTGLSQRLVS
jgi:uncharacterized protein